MVPPASRSRRAFTLVELLVVVGVLVFLIAMLVPALAKAQRQARTATCLANVSQLVLGYQTYAHQNHEHSPLLDPSGKTFWLDALRPNLPDVKDILLCPEANTPSYGWGTDKLAWGPFDPAHGSPASISLVGGNCSSYGFNGWLYATLDELGGPSTWFRGRSADKIPVFADATWVDGWPQESDAAPADTTGAGANHETGLARFYIARHGTSVNVAFIDGHAEQVPLDALSTKIWSNLGSSRLTDMPSR